MQLLERVLGRGHQWLVGNIELDAKETKVSTGFVVRWFNRLHFGESIPPAPVQP